MGAENGSADRSFSALSSLSENADAPLEMKDDDAVSGALSASAASARRLAEASDKPPPPPRARE
jgi:hypothetical protein